MKHFPETVKSQVACTGIHCKIHKSVRIKLEIKSTMIAMNIGVRKTFVAGIRLKKKQMDIFVHIKVAKVWIHSPYE